MESVPNVNGARVRDFIAKEVADWDNEVIAVARFKAFSGQRCDWEATFLFWKHLIIKIATHFRLLHIRPSQVKNDWFNRVGLTPLCLDNVLGDKVSLSSGALSSITNLDYDVLHLIWTNEKLQQQMDVTDRRYELLLKLCRLEPGLFEENKISVDAQKEVEKMLEQTPSYMDIEDEDIEEEFKKLELAVGKEAQVPAPEKTINAEGKAADLSSDPFSNLNLSNRPAEQPGITEAVSEGDKKTMKLEMEAVQV